MSQINPAHRVTVSYIDKSRDYYADKGFTNPYRWATYQTAPFSKLQKPLSQSRVAIVTTSAPNELSGQRENRAVWSAPSTDIPDGLHTHHVFWHKTATHTNDLGTFLPLDHLHASAASGRIGGVGPRFYGVPTTYSQRQTSEEDAPAILKMCQEDQIDAVIFIPM